MSERDLASEEIVEVLDELADLSERDPAGYRQVISEARTEAEQQEQGLTLLGMIENATQRRQEQDRALLDAIFRENKGEGSRHVGAKE